MAFLLRIQLSILHCLEFNFCNSTGFDLQNCLNVMIKKNNIKILLKLEILFVMLKPIIQQKNFFYVFNI